MAEADRHSFAPTDSLEEHLRFFIDILTNLQYNFFNNFQYTCIIIMYLQIAELV